MSRSEISGGIRMPLSLGVVGGSLRSAIGYAHYVSSRMDGRWSIDAGCFSKDAQDNAEAADAYGVLASRTYLNWRDFLAAESGRLDCILLLTPTPSHFEMVVACLEAGVPVICEKALATNSSEAQKILEICEANKGFLAVTYNYSGYPMVRELRQIIATGRLGKILHFQAEMPQEGFVRTDSHGNKPTPQSWRLTDGAIPTIYLDLAVHLHQLIWHLIRQEPISVVADQSGDGCFPDIVDNVMCLARYSEGARGQFWFSKSALGHRNGMKLRLYGEAGSAEWYQANPEELVLAFKDGRREILDRASGVAVANLGRYNRFKSGHPAGFLEGFANLYCDLASCLRAYQATGTWTSEDVYGPELAYDGLRFLDAIAQSAKTNQWCMVPNRAEARGQALKSKSVRKFIIEGIEKKAPLPTGCDLDAFNFIDSGHVDPMGIKKFILDIEHEFNVDIAPLEMESTIFRTIGGLTRMVETKMGAK